MTDTRVVKVTLGGAPPQIVIRAREISNEDWYRVALLLTDSTPPIDTPMIVGPERFLRERLALQGLLREMGVGLEVDGGVRRLLIRSRDDQQALAENLQGGRTIRDAPANDRAAQNHDGDRRIIRELRPFQQRDLEILSNLRHGANFSVPGSGKTTVTYVLHARERAAGRAVKLLVIAPLSAFDAWESDAKDVFDPPLTVARWRGGNAPDSDVILINYQRLARASSSVIDLLAQYPTHLVLDEAHRAKRGALGEWGRALLALAPFATRRDILTGTPAPNHPRDLAAILDILWPGGAVSRMLPAAALRTDPPQSAMRDVNSVIAPLYARTTKSELGLTDPAISLDIVPMGHLQQQIYDAMLSRYKGLFDFDRRDAAMFAQMGEITIYLLQAASSPRLLANNADAARAYRFPPLTIPVGSRLARLVEDYADHEVPAKVERACRIVHANAALGRKTLVWSNFPDNLLDLEQQLSALNPALVYGAILSDADADAGIRTREREIERFRNDNECLVLLANPAAMSEGVSLHRWCHDAIYLDRTFNAGQYLQSLDRIHRLGLDPETETRITLLSSQGTIDERVNGRVEDKARRLSLMLDDPFLVQMSLPDDANSGGVLDDELDLEEVMNHLAYGIPRRNDGDG